MSGLAFDYMVFNLLGIEDRTMRYFVEMAQRNGKSPYEQVRDLLDLLVEDITKQRATPHPITSTDPQPEQQVVSLKAYKRAHQPRKESQ